MTASGLSKDALHVHVGIGVFLAVSVLLRKPLKPYLPWLAVLIVALTGEFIDMLTNIYLSGHWRWAASTHDIVNTMFWPTIILLLVRFTRVFDVKIRNLITLFLSGFAASALFAAPTGEKPNIIFILADDLGYGDLGCYGQQKIETPNIDKLAAEGIRFTQHYSGNTVCAPSRSALATGQHTGHTTIRGNGPYELRPSPQDVTIFEALKSTNYHTALIGKSILSGNSKNGHQPNRKGVDYFFGFVNHQAAHSYFPPILFRNGNEVVYPNNSNHEGDNYTGDLFFNEVINYIGEQKKAPFFLFYASQIPHASLYAPEEWKKKYRGRFEETPLTGQTHYRNEPEPKTTYAAMVSRLDWEVGEIIKKLKKLGIEKNTLVIFSSDNGPVNLPGFAPEFFNSSGPFRGLKRDLTEGGIRIPMIVWWPDKIAPGTVTKHVAAFWDFLPTACELAGVSPPQGTDGISYLPTLLGTPQKEHEFLYWEFYEGGGKRAALLDGRWKGIQLNLNEDLNSPIYIYDLQTDLHEDTNIAAQHPELVTRVKEVFEREHTPSDKLTWKR